MARVNTGFLGFNAGVLSVESLSRTDLERTRFGAETMTNFLPKPSGAMTVRPGTRYLGHTQGDNFVQLIPFVKNIDQTAVVELTDLVMRAWVNDALVTRVSVSSAVTNGTFNADIAGWTDADDSGGTSSWAVGGYMQLLGDGTDFARRYQEITVGGGDLNKEHALRIIVNRGPIILRVGSAATADNYIAETTLPTGIHSLALTPAGNFFIQVSARETVAKLIDSIVIEAAGVMTITTIWPQTALAAQIKYDQIEDVIFCAGGAAYRPQRIERRASGRSWSVVDYAPTDGPFFPPNSSGVTLTPSGLTGTVTLTASRDFFNPNYIGALFYLTHIGQLATDSFSGDDVFTDPIRISGITAGRAFTVVISGVFVATLTLQKSYGEPGAWVDDSTYTVPTTGTTKNDGLDNQIVYYRIGIKAGDFTSGTAVATLIYSSGSQNGIVRVVSYSSATSVGVDILQQIGRAEATSDWREGMWSLYRGYPRTVAYYDGRLWWGLEGSINGSVSDSFASFNPDFEGDAGPINRSVGKGSAVWMLSLGRLIVGSAIQETSIRSSSFDTPLTPTDFSYKAYSTEGTSGVIPIQVDGKAVHVQRGLTRLLLETFDVNVQDYVPEDLTRLCEDICSTGIKCIAIQRQPHTRIWAVQTDGSIAVLTYQAKDGVVAWSKIVTVGTFEFVTVLPGSAGEDLVYFSVVRLVSATPNRFIEKLSREDACTGGTVCELMDALVLYSGAPTGTLTGLSHLNGNQVVVWGDGFAKADVDAPLTVSGGSITLAGGATTVAAATGLPYNPAYKSHKLAYGAQLGTALSQRKRVDHLGAILKNTAWKGFYYGMDFTAGGLVQIQPDYQGAAVAATTIFSTYDYDMGSFPGQWDTDSRVCIAIRSPYPATVCSLQIGMVTEEVGMELQSSQG